MTAWSMAVVSVALLMVLVVGIVVFAVRLGVQRWPWSYHPPSLPTGGRASRRTALDEVAAERGKQDAEWGPQDHGPFLWLTIAGEEFGEAARAALDGRAEAYRLELIHLAAVVVAAVESLDRGKTEMVDVTTLVKELAELREQLRRNNASV